LGGAINTAAELPGRTAEPLLESAFHAFDSGVTVTAGIASVLMVAAAWLAFRTLRDAQS
jgi:DHA2 family multidrug resistance protein-like MFS transporter